MANTNNFRLFTRLIFPCFFALKSSALSDLKLYDGSCDYVINPPSALGNQIPLAAVALDDFFTPFHPSLPINEGEEIRVGYRWNNLVHSDIFQGTQLSKYSHQSRNFSQSEAIQNCFQINNTNQAAYSYFWSSDPITISYVSGFDRCQPFFFIGTYWAEICGGTLDADPNVSLNDSIVFPNAGFYPCNMSCTWTISVVDIAKDNWVIGIHVQQFDFNYKQDYAYLSGSSTPTPFVLSGKGGSEHGEALYLGTFGNQIQIQFTSGSSGYKGGFSMYYTLVVRTFE